MASQSTLASSNIPFFVQNQILRAQDLNKLVQALQAQLRQTRVFNIGVGIVNGLKVSVNSTNNVITITGGLAISSDGYQFEMQECELTHYKPVRLSEDAFDCETRQKCDSEVKIIEDSTGGDANVVYELEGFENDNIIDTEEWSPITDAFMNIVHPLDNEQTSVIKDKFCLILLWCEGQQERKSCFNDCEEKGADQFVNIRKLLIRQEEYEDIFTPDESEESDTPIVDLPSAPKIYRFGFDNTNNTIDLCNIISWEQLYNSYRKECGLVLQDLEDIYSSAFTNFYQKTNRANEGAQNPFAGLKDALELYSDDFAEAYNSNDWDIQYWYAYLRDLITAYEEFCGVANGLAIVGSNSDESLENCLFPGHVSLGWIKEGAAEGNTEADNENNCRTGRILPNIFPETQERINLALCLYDRMVAMAEQSNVILPTLSNTQTNITPSAYRFRYLRGRALPFYYRAGVANYWSCEEGKVEAYRYTGLSDNPLLCEICRYDFFRVEGHLGKTVAVALKGNQDTTGIETLRHELNIPFDILTLRLGPNLEEISEEKDLIFGELEEVYQNTRADILCKIEEIRDISQGNIPYDSVVRVYDFLIEADSVRSIQTGIDVSMLIDQCLDAEEAFENFTLGFMDDYAQAFNETTSDQELPALPEGLGKVINDLVCRYKVQEIKVLQQKSFHCFARAHPGLEHKGGVPKGGTLVLVYSYTIQPTQIAFFDGILEGDISGLSDEAIISAAIEDEDIELKQIESKVVKTVVADFCLPYLCCSNAPIVRNEIRAVRPQIIGETVFCRDDFPDEGYAYSFSPMGGVLRVYVNGEERTNQGISTVQNDWLLTSGLLADGDFDNYRAEILLVYELGTEKAEKLITVYSLPDITEVIVDKVAPCYELDENGQCIIVGYQYRIAFETSDGPVQPEHLTKFLFKLGAQNAEGNYHEEVDILNNDGLKLPNKITLGEDDQFESLEYCLRFEWRITDDSNEHFNEIPIELCLENGPCIAEPLLVYATEICEDELKMSIIGDPEGEGIGIDDDNNYTYPVINDEQLETGFFELTPSIITGNFSVAYMNENVAVTPLPVDQVILKTVETDEAGNNDCSSCRYIFIYNREQALAYLSSEGVSDDHPLAFGIPNAITGLPPNIGSYEISYDVSTCIDHSFSFNLVSQQLLVFNPREENALSAPPAEEAKPESSEEQPLPSSAQARKLLARRQAAYLDILEEHKEDMGNSKGYKLANLFITTQAGNEKLAEDYQETTTSIFRGLGAANEENQPKYLQVLEATTFSLMDKLAMQSSQELPVAATEALQDTAAKMEEYGVKLNSLRRRWKAPGLREVLDKERVNELFDWLKLDK